MTQGSILDHPNAVVIDILECGGNIGETLGTSGAGGLVQSLSSSSIRLSSSALNLFCYFTSKKHQNI